jgi:hypothetical protein
MDGVGSGLEAAGLYRTDKGMQKAALQSQFDDTRAKGLSIAKDSDFLIDPSAYGRGKDFGEGYKMKDYREQLKQYDFTNPDYNRRYAAGMEGFYNSALGGFIGR